MPRSFFDTNVLVYTASSDIGKADIASTLIKLGGTISVQNLNEAMNVARRKMKLSWSDVEEMLAYFRRSLMVCPVDIETHEVGMRLSMRHGFAPYDAMIVAAALQTGCDVLWSEDMHDGLVVDDRLTIRNPFAALAAT